MRKLMNWEELKKAVAKRYDEIVTDDNLLLGDEDLVILDLEEERINVARDIRSKDGSTSTGYKLLQ